MPKSTTIKYPPGPKYKARPFKLVREFLHDPIKSIQEISDKYGDIAYFKLGRQRIYLLNNPDYIEKVLVYGHRNFTKGKKLQVAKAILGEGLVTSEGELHTRQRRMIQPIFHPKQVSVYGKIVTEFATNMELRWKNGETLDISKEMMQLTLGIICKSVLNYDVASEAEGYGKALTTLINHGKRLKSPLGHVLNKIPILPSVKGAREAKEKLDELVYGLVQQRREAIQSKVNSNDDLLSHLLQAQDNGKSSSRATTANVSTASNFDSSSLGMSDKQARDEVMTIFLAGHETTANALTWTFYLLSQNPTIDAKLLEELKSVIGDTGTVTVEDIPKLEYTEKVLRESMRLFPPVWSMSRHADIDFTLGDFTIPEGSSIVMSQYVMHRNPLYYNEPNLFYPDRWNTKMRSSLPRFSYFPFGGGMRACIGEAFAWMEGILVLANIAQSWKMKLVRGHPVELDPGITLRPKYGMKMKLEKKD